MATIEAEPTAERRAEIERAVEAMRARKRARALAGHPEAEDSPMGDNGTINGHGPVNRVAAFQAKGRPPCPKCGGKVGKNLRCYRCSPSGAKAKDTHQTRSLAAGLDTRVSKADSADRQQARQLLSKLPRSEAQVITFRFGLDDQGRRSLDATAKLCGFSATKVGKLERKALARLKAAGVTLKPPAPPVDEGLLPLPIGRATTPNQDNNGILNPAAPLPFDDEDAKVLGLLQSLMPMTPAARRRVMARAGAALGIGEG